MECEPLAEAQKTATFRIIETRISREAVDRGIVMDRADRCTVWNDRPQRRGGTWHLPLVLVDNLAENDRGTVMIFVDLLDQRSCRMIRSIRAGDDARANLQVEADQFARIKRHHLVSHFHIKGSS